jgi:hypothetical protein
LSFSLNLGFISAWQFSEYLSYQSNCCFEYIDIVNIFDI